MNFELETFFYKFLPKKKPNFIIGIVHKKNKKC